MELYLNIKKRREELGLSQEELAKETGYTSRTSIAKIESGKVDLPQSKIETFAKALKTTPSKLMGWVDNKTSSEIDTTNTYNFLSIPLYASISAGYGSCQAEFIEMLPVPGLKPNGTEYFAVRVVGDSMEPKIPDNSIIIIKKDIAIENGEIGAFCFNETSYVKQKRVVNGRLILHSFNLAYEPIVVTEYDDFKEYGKVVKVLIDL